MNVYLDIDGVILANDKTPANFANDFLEYIITNYPVFWLTTHCRGDAQYTVILIRRFFESKTMKLLERIAPTDWRENKTEAIDFSQPFIWFEDDLLEAEKEELRRHKALKNWVKVNLYDNPDQLQDLLGKMRQNGF